MSNFRALDWYVKESLFLFLFILMYVSLSAQEGYSYELFGPYDVYNGPYHIRTKITYLHSSDDWTNSLDLQSKSQGILDYINEVFNPYSIYFISENMQCEPSFDKVEIQATSIPFDSLDDPTRLDILVRNEESSSTAQFGSESIPGTYVWTLGKGFGIPASSSAGLIKSIGFSLGLHTTHMDVGVIGVQLCSQANGEGCPIGINTMICECCDDQVCDTELHDNASIDVSFNTINGSCTSSSGLPPEIFRNYMSAVSDFRCQDLFTYEQVRRMWEMLAEAPDLKNTLSNSVIPIPVSANIIVGEGEVVEITSPIEMLPGSAIIVERGGYLKVRSSISGACGSM